MPGWNDLALLFLSKILAASFIMKEKQEYDRDFLYVDFNCDNGELPSQEAIERAKSLYQSLGCFVARRFFSAVDYLPLENALRFLISTRLRLSNITSYKINGRFDDGFIELVNHARLEQDVIFRACLRLLPMKILAVDPRILEVTRSLIPSDLLMSSNFMPIKSDLPHSYSGVFPWHQDYPPQMDSSDGLIFWCPIQSVAADMTLLLAPGSHSLGLLPCKWVGDKPGYSYYELASPEISNRFPVVAVPVEKGDVVVCSTMCLHASQVNRGPYTRWTPIFRFGNFKDDLAVKKNWPGSLYEGYSFAKICPEMVTNIAEVPEFLK